MTVVLKKVKFLLKIHCLRCRHDWVADPENILSVGGKLSPGDVAACLAAIFLGRAVGR